MSFNKILRCILATAICIYLIHPDVSYAKLNSFLKNGIGCWEQVDKKSHFALVWCFRENGSVQGERSGWHDGFVDNGVFRADLDNVVILGFPGEAWPAANMVEDCRYRFEDSERVLVFEGCSIAGRWSKSDRKPLDP